MGGPTVNTDNNRRWRPGQSGNPSGRPKGSRNKLSESFLQALADDFEQHGREVVETVRMTRPHEYLKIVAAVLPKQMEIERDKSDITKWTTEELVAFLNDCKAEQGDSEKTESMPNNTSDNGASRK